MTEHTTDVALPEGIGGYVEPGFGAVADAFAGNFERGDVGASCALWVDGRPVVDLWGGIADPRDGRRWEADTVAILFSITKGVSSICAQLLVERGLLDLDALVTEYWPEYGTAGKERTTVRHVLSHRTGLPVIDGEVTLEDLADHDGMAARMAAQAPLFEPGSTHAYQAVTFSWTFGELFRRVAGESIGTFLAREIVEPYGLELWLGLPPELEPKVAPILPVDVPEELVLAFLPPGSLPWRAMTVNGLMPVKIVGDELGLNDPTFHHLELAAANGISNARALAKLYAAVIGEVDGRPPLLRPETVAAASVVRSSGQGFGEAVPGASWGTGFMRPFPRQPQLGGASFGHDGAGGSIAFAEPERGIAFSHVANQMVVTMDQDPRTRALLDAVEACTR